MTAPKRPKRPPVVLRWLRLVGDEVRGDDSPGRPSVQAIELVALHRALHADADGGNCYPAQATLARLAEVDRVTVRRVDRWLLERGLMVHVRNRKAGLKEYRLAIPAVVDGGDDHHLPPVQMVAAATISTPADGGLDGAQMVVATTTTSSPPNVSEEGGGGPTGAPGGAPPVPAIDVSPEVRSVIGAIATGADVELMATAELVGIIDALLADGWARLVIVERGVRQAKKATANPTSYVAEGLRRLHTGGAELQAWARFANAYAQIHAVEGAIEDEHGERVLDYLSERHGVLRLEQEVPGYGDLPGTDFLNVDEYVHQHLNPDQQLAAAEKAERLLAALRSEAALLEPF